MLFGCKGLSYALWAEVCVGPICTFLGNLHLEVVLGRQGSIIVQRDKMDWKAGNVLKKGKPDVFAVTFQ